MQPGDIVSLYATAKDARKTVNTVENGVFTPSALLAIKLAQALSVPVEELFWLED